MALVRAQKRFIRKKVKQLGSYEEVRRFYAKSCLVTDYALQLAGELWPDRKPKTRKRARA